jgi:hypothetical protein
MMPDAPSAPWSGVERRRGITERRVGLPERRKRGRPAVLKDPASYTLRLEGEQYDRLYHGSKRCGLSMTAFVREVVDAGLSVIEKSDRARNLPP